MTENIAVRSFAFIVDGDVIGTIHIPSTGVNHQRLWAGLSSNPIVVESTNFPDVQFGWTYDGQTFIEPQAYNG
jgi:hypothetical protein